MPGPRQNDRWPRCPWCGYHWPHKLQVSFAVVREDGLVETVVQCPCRKSGILLRFLIQEARLLDIEGAKLYGLPEAEVAVRMATPEVNRHGVAHVVRHT